MKAVGADIIFTNILNDEEKPIMTILVGRNTSLEERLAACEFIVGEIKEGIVKQKEELEKTAESEETKDVEEVVVEEIKE